jgi:multidrug efflux pump subunit AcrB
MVVLKHRRLSTLFFVGLSAVSLLLLPFLGQDFFPTVDGGQIKLHLRAPTGTRIEETAKLTDQVEAAVRRIIPAHEVQTMADNIGLPYSGINLSYSNSAPIGPADADILISLSEDHHPTADYVRSLRKTLPRQFPGTSFAFLPADIVSQILNFGLPSPIDVQVIGPNLQANRKYATELVDRFRHIPGIADLRIQQAFDYPELHVDVDRARAQDLGMSQLSIANNLLIGLSGSFQTTPTFWLSPANGVSYPVVTQIPQYDLDSLQALEDIPVNDPGSTVNVAVDGTGQAPQLLRAVARISRGAGVAVASHYNVQSVIDIFAAAQDRDLGGVGADVERVLAQTTTDLPKGSTVISRGQMQTMSSSFRGLFGGLAFAIVLVYLLIVVNFQSWLDPFIIVTALPVAIAGIVWMLFVTHTSMSVPALTGAIMCMGVATANSILVVSFAREKLNELGDSVAAALEAGFGRFRPVLMTALAMIIGMIPMALGFGEGGEQNAPLGRAVIGGLLFATVATLFFVPAVFSMVHAKRPAPAPPSPAPH